ncbi:hypothetical protein CSH63_01070 [Micromonospora tulbaghiae]|uniref:Phage tail protein n=1 Tax=Micromonospora tulbaghiae TaxID=479978 RepID=A0A386WCR1_9ACTN|nr:hypothetical protein [Micromonospora tulbaghiae]AYF26075.1 hypothetical protein CSH63_01070 [Micromonospora tulbaghiae]
MATLTLTKLWINHAGTGAAIAAQSAPGRTRTITTPGQVQTYAAGTRRPIAAGTRDDTYTFTLRLITTAQLDTLTSWIGQPVQIRNDRGLLLHATYFAIDTADIRGEHRYDATITAHTIGPPDEPALVL